MNDDTMQRDTDAGFLAWIQENPNDMAVYLALEGWYN